MDIYTKFLFEIFFGYSVDIYAKFLSEIFLVIPWIFIPNFYLKYFWLIRGYLQQSPVKYQGDTRN